MKVNESLVAGRQSLPGADPGDLLFLIGSLGSPCNPDCFVRLPGQKRDPHLMRSICGHGGYIIARLSSTTVPRGRDAAHNKELLYIPPLKRIIIFLSPSGYQPTDVT